MNVEVVSLSSIIKFFKDDNLFQEDKEKLKSDCVLEFKITDDTVTKYF